jgi:hypothetical protein
MPRQLVIALIGVNFSAFPLAAAFGQARTGLSATSAEMLSSREAPKSGAATTSSSASFSDWAQRSVAALAALVQCPRTAA